MSTCLPIQRVLYVEDHPVNVQLMQALFARRPRARLLVAATAAAGLAQALDETPDLLLLDLRLPDCHGTELLQRMRAHAPLAEVPAIAVTAEDAADLSGCGFAEVWQKPMDLHATLARLDRWLERAAKPVAQCVEPPSPEPARTAGRAPRPIPFPTAAP